MPKLQIISNNAFRKKATEADFRRSSGVFYDDIFVVTPEQALSKIISLRHRFLVGKHQLEVYVNGLFKRILEDVDGTDYGDYEEITDYQIQFVPGLIFAGDAVRVRITWGSYLPAHMASEVTHAAGTVGQDVFGDNYDVFAPQRGIGSLDSSTHIPDLSDYRTWKIMSSDALYSDFAGGEPDQVRYIIFDETGSMIQGKHHLVQIGNFTGWRYITTGRRISHSLALRNDDSLWAWGYNQNGQLGIGNTDTKEEPVQVGVETNWRTVKAGNSFTIGIKNDGTLWSWGNNTYGQLGLGDTTPRLYPHQIGLENDWEYISCGHTHVFAINSTGHVFSWGHNSHGELGLGHNNSVDVPTEIVSLHNQVEKVVCGDFFTLTLNFDGTIHSVGANSHGQLGLGDQSNRNTFIPVGTDIDWDDIDAGQFHSMAIKTDTTGWGWGNNDFGQLGIGNTIQQTTPVQITTHSGFINMYCGDFFTLAIRTGDTTMTWGKNSENQLGLYNSFSQVEPQLLNYTENWNQCAGGSEYSLFLRSDGTLWAAGSDIPSRGVTPPPYPIKLQNGDDFRGQEGDTIQLLCDGESWYEISRSLNAPNEIFYGYTPPPPPPPALMYLGYIFGGWDGTVHLNDCDEHDPSTDIWVSKTDMALPLRSAFAASTIAGKSFVYGGINSGGYLSDCDEYDPNVNMWSSKADMVTPPRCNLAASTIMGLGYTYAGYYNDGSGHYLRDCDEFNPTGNSWSSKADITPAAEIRSKLAGGTINDKGYIFAGRNEVECLNDCHEFDSVLNSWSGKTNIPSPSRSELSTTTIDNKGYIFGGDNDDEFYVDCDEYTQITDSWASINDMPGPARSNMAACTLDDDKGYVYGGSYDPLTGSELFYRDCDEVHPSTNTWVSRGDIPVPARNDHAATSIGS